MVIFGYTVLDLPLWVALLCYPVIGVLVALIVLLNAYVFREKADQKAPKSLGREPQKEVSNLRESDS